MIKQCQTENCKSIVKGRRSKYCDECFRKICSTAGKKGGTRQSKSYLVLEARIKSLEKQLQTLQGLLNKQDT